MKRILPLLLSLAALSAGAQPILQRATPAQVSAGTDNSRYITPYAAAQAGLSSPTGGVSFAVASNLAYQVSSTNSTLGNAATATLATNSLDSVLRDEGYGTNNTFMGHVTIPIWTGIGGSIVLNPFDTGNNPITRSVQALDFQSARTDTYRTASSGNAIFWGGNNLADSILGGAIILGGTGNTNQGNDTVIAAGGGNYTDAVDSFLGAGIGNVLSASFSFLGSGQLNYMTGDWNIIGGGATNSLTASRYASILGGTSNTNAAAGQHQIGSYLTNNNNFGIALGYRTNALTITTNGYVTAEGNLVFRGNASGISNAVVLNEGANVTITPAGDGRTFSIAASGGSGDVTAAGQNNFTGSNNFSGGFRVTGSKMSVSDAGITNADGTGNIITMSPTIGAGPSPGLAMVDSSTFYDFTLGTAGLFANAFASPILSLNFTTGDIEFAGTATGDGSGLTSVNAATATTAAGSDSTSFPVFVDAATGNQALRTDTAFTYDPTTDTLGVAALRAATNALPGDIVIPAGKVSGTNISANLTVTGFSGVDHNYWRGGMLWVTNDGATDRSITFQTGTRMATNSFVLANVVWCTNRAVTIISHGVGFNTTNVAAAAFY